MTHAKEKNPPGPKDRLFGLSLARAFHSRPLEFISKLAVDYGDLSYFRMGPFRTYVVNHPDLIHEILVERVGSYRRLWQQTRVMRLIEGDGLFISEGELWKGRRRQVQQGFNLRCMEGYAEVVVEQTERMLDRWRDGSEIDIADEMGQLALLIMGKSLLGIDLSQQADEIRKLIHEISGVLFREMRSVVQADWLPLPSKRNKRRVLREFHELMARVVRMREMEGAGENDLLGMLIAAAKRGEISRQGVVDETATVFNGGHDTPAAGLTWLSWLVARNPEVETKVLGEADEMLRGRAPMFDDLRRLKYTGMVVKETLRMYPPAWTLFAREPLQDVVLGDYQVRQGSWLFLFPYMTQRDARFFDAPQRFDPERFAPSRIERIPQSAYFPFGAGPRTCIGNTFSMMMMTLVATLMLRRFHLSLIPGKEDVEPEPLLNLWPHGGLRVVVRRRQEACPADPSRELTTTGLTTP